MANISLKSMLEASIDPKLVARSKKTGKLVYFKTPDAKAAAVKSGSHEEPKKDKKAQAKQAAQSADMFKGDYSKERGAKDNSNWMDNLDSIDISDIKGKADPNADSFKSNDVYGATFKDPQTGKTITVGDAYEREDDSPAYQKAFAYVAKFDPDKEVVMGHPEYGKSDDNSNWMDNIDDIDVSDIKGKADPNADSFTSADLYGATFKDPETGKTITVGDAYEREDDSEAYKKAFAYVSKFDPDKEAVMGTQAYDDLNKKASPEPKITANWKPDEDGKMSFDAATDVENHLNAVLGTDGVAEVDYYGGSIEYRLEDGENGIFVGPHYDNSKLYAVSFEGPSMDIDKIEASYKTFKNPKDALQYAGELAKANRKGLEQKQESTKLTSMIKK